MRQTNTILFRVLFGFFALLAYCGCQKSPIAADLTLLCGIDEAWKLETCEQSAQRFTEKSGHNIRIIDGASQSGDTLELIVELLAVGSSSLDVLQMDVVWPAVLERYLADLGSDGYQIAANQISSARQVGTVNGRLIALPLNADVGALYYRADLLEKHQVQPPKTWRDLREASLDVIAGEGGASARLDGYLFQGRAEEALVSNALEWTVNAGGSRWIENGSLRVNTPPLKAMLSAAQGWIGEAAPQGNLEFGVRESLERYAAGEAVFMRQWVSMASQLEEMAPEIASGTTIMALPNNVGEVGVGTLGGTMVGVSIFSEHPDAAAELAIFLASREEQETRAIENQLLPSNRELLMSVSEKKDGARIIEIAALLRNAVSRPTAEIGPGYPRFSSELAGSIHSILAGDEDAEEQLDALQRRLDRLTGGGQRW